MNKKNSHFLTLVLILGACLVLSSCDTLWDIQETADISITLEAEDFLCPIPPTVITLGGEKDSPIKNPLGASLCD